MKKIHKKICVLINDLHVIYETLNSLTIEAEIATPRIRVDDYFKILSATSQIKETLNNLGNLKIIRGEDTSYRTLPPDPLGD